MKQKKRLFEALLSLYVSFIRREAKKGV